MQEQTLQQEAWMPAEVFDKVPKQAAKKKAYIWSNKSIDSIYGHNSNRTCQAEATFVSVASAITNSPERSSTGAIPKYSTILQLWRFFHKIMTPLLRIWPTVCSPKETGSTRWSGNAETASCKIITMMANHIFFRKLDQFSLLLGHVRMLDDLLDKISCDAWDRKDAEQRIRHAVDVMRMK